jgi:hypothetical protein
MVRFEGHPRQVEGAGRDTVKNLWNWQIVILHRPQTLTLYKFPLPNAAFGNFFPSDNLTYFKVPQAVIDSIRSKLAFKIFDEYANILKGMYSTRFNGRPKNKGDHDQMDTAPGGPSPPLITSLQAW